MPTNVTQSHIMGMGGRLQGSGDDRRTPLLNQQDGGRVVSDMSPEGDKDKGQDELSNDMQAAWALHEAMCGNYFEELPVHTAAWAAFRKYISSERWAWFAIWTLIGVSMFETPLWCNSTGRWSLVAGGSVERCTIEGGMQAQDIILSGTRYLPPMVGICIESLCYLVVLLKVAREHFLDNYFFHLGDIKGKVSYNSDVLRKCEGLLAVIGLADAAYFVLNEGALFRTAPYVRFLLAVLTPSVRRVARSFLGVVKATSKIAMFLLGTILLFAWVMAMIMDDFEETTRHGVPVNLGYENFGNAIYTTFVCVTTANLPAAMTPTYMHNRKFVFLWIPFFAITICIFMQVILAMVYSEYTDQTKSTVQIHFKNRLKGIRHAFKLVGVERNKELCVSFDQFVGLVNLMRVFGRVQVDEQLLHIVFRALDDDGNSVLMEGEFRDMIDVLQYNYTLTTRDSIFMRKCPKVLKGLKKLCTNKSVYKAPGEEGDEDHDVGYGDRFDGSKFDYFMDGVLILNVLWVIFESYYDLNDMTEAPYFAHIDLFFSFVYLLDVFVKLLIWSWQEYWFFTDNRFDFATTLILAGGGVAYLLPFVHVTHDTLKFIQMLRLLRLLKALNEIPAFKVTVATISRMVTSCGDVAMMLFLVFYLWSAIGVQCFGGELYDENTRFVNKTWVHQTVADGAAAAGYFESGYQSLNFNDMLTGFVTCFNWMLAGYIQPVCDILMGLYEPWSPAWFAACAYCLGFYIACVLLAFNVFTAFSIDVYCFLEKAASQKDPEPSEVEKNLQKIRADLADKGQCLHVASSSELDKSRVYRSLFAADGGDDDDDKEDKDK